MKRQIYFGDFDGPFWPLPAQLEPYFLDPAGESWPRDGGNDEWGLSADGLYGTNDLADEQSRARVDLYITGYPKLGVTLHYSKWDGRTKQKSYFASQGNLRRLSEIVYSMQGTPMSAGLFVSFADAYRALKEFMETDGELPTCIEWGPGVDIPDEAFLHPNRRSS